MRLWRCTHLTGVAEQETTDGGENGPSDTNVTVHCNSKALGASALTYMLVGFQYGSTNSAYNTGCVRNLSGNFSVYTSSFLAVTVNDLIKSVGAALF